MLVKFTSTSSPLELYLEHSAVLKGHNGPDPVPRFHGPVTGDIPEGVPFTVHLLVYVELYVRGVVVVEGETRTGHAVHLK